MPAVEVTWVAELPRYLFCPASSLRERIVMKKAMYAAKPWDSQKHCQAESSSVSFSSGAAGCRRKGAGHICMILSALSSLGSQCLPTLVTEHPSSGSPTPLHPVPFKVLFPWGKPLSAHSGTWLEVCCWATVQTSVRLLKEVLTHRY